MQLSYNSLWKSKSRVDQVSIWFNEDFPCYKRDLKLYALVREIWPNLLTNGYILVKSLTFKKIIIWWSKQQDQALTKLSKFSTIILLKGKHMDSIFKVVKERNVKLALSSCTDLQVAKATNSSKPLITPGNTVPKTLPTSSPRISIRQLRNTWIVPCVLTQELDIVTKCI